MSEQISSPNLSPQEAVARAAQALQAGRLDEAEALGARAWAALPGDPDVGNLYAVVLAQKGRGADAIAILRKAAAARPEDPRAHFNLGYLLQLAGDFEGAKRAYEASGKAQPNYVPAWLNLGNLELHLRAPAPAEAAFQRVLAVEPRHTGALEGLGIALILQERLDDAAEVLRRGVAIDPRNAGLHANLGIALHSRGDNHPALDSFRHAVALRPDDGELHAYMAEALYDLGDYQGVIAATDGSDKRQHGYSRATAYRAMALAEKGRTEEAWRLVDVDRLLIRHHVKPPPGVASLDDFHTRLAAAVRRHATLVEDRPGKTTRNGFQTGELFDGSDPVYDEMRSIILQTLQNHATPKTDPDHPFWRRRPQRWKLATWANVLHQDGFKASHNHASGWMSGVYYVKVPAVTAIDDSTRPGWIEFGRPDQRHRYSVEPPISYIRPEEGLMILFPSYFWHCTVPFSSNEERISLAFDVVPEP